MNNFLNLLPFFIIIAIALVVIFTELIKKLDRKGWLKGYRVYIPIALSFGAAYLLKVGNFYVTEQMWFWWAVIFGFSIFGYEAVLRKVSAALDGGEKTGE
jgi:Na+-translocating ferredoxin:NAD+ oxidoreductase RnfA subunit